MVESPAGLYRFRLPCLDRRTTYPFPPAHSETNPRFAAGDVPYARIGIRLAGVGVSNRTIVIPLTNRPAPQTRQQMICMPELAYSEVC